MALSQEEEDALAELQSKLKWPLPTAYLTFIREQGSGAFSYVRPSDQYRTLAFLFSPSFVLRRMRVGVANVKNGQLEFGDTGGGYFVVDLPTERVFFWDREENEFQDGPDNMKLLYDTAAAFLATFGPETTG